MSFEFKITDYQDYYDLFDHILEDALLENLNVYRNFQNVFDYAQNLIVPCVGADYQNHRILIIGESKYYTPSDSNDTDYYLWALSRFLENDSIKYDERKAKGILNAHKSAIFSKEPFISYKKFISDKRGTNEYNSWPFVNVIKEMLTEMSEEQALKSVAFTNFYPVPSVAIGKYNGFNKTRFNALLSSQINTRSARQKLWELYNEKCVETIDLVIDVLQPNLILFVSGNASNHYKLYNGKYKDENQKVFYLYHSSGNNTWYRKNKNYENKSSCEICRQAILNLLQKT